jgi:uncharacterized phiE125 gp8 family phage protein
MIRVRNEPRVEPVTLAEARRWLGMTDDNDTDQDAEIQLLVKAFRRYAEKRTGRRFVDQDLELVLDCWPRTRAIELPVAPIVAIDYVRYINTSGALTSFYEGAGSPNVGQSLVDIDVQSQPGRIQPAFGESWPSIRGGDFNSIRIGFTAGYGTGGSPEDLSVIPEELKVWLRVRLATLFENREAIIIGTIVNDVPRSLHDALLDPLMLGRRIG